MREVTLQKPIERKGSDPIAEVKVREPKVGDIRGLTQKAIAEMETKAMERLLPRITLPPLLPEELAAMNVSDFFKLSAAALSFLMPEAEREAAGLSE